MASPPGPRSQLILSFVAGALLVLLAIFADPLLGRPREWGATETLVLIAGAGNALAGWLARRGRLGDLISHVSLSILAVFATVGMAEGAFRLSGVDLTGQERAWRELAPYYRQPTVPMGEVFFRREGPDEWTGQVINTQMKRYEVSPNPYADEPVITVRYDSLGFRALDGVDDWEIVVTGDSFTELGYLAYERTFTKILGDVLNVRVRNLGVSQTGPLTQLSYLRAYGVAPSTKHAVIVFFEGNDLWDLGGEYQALTEWRATGRREYRRREGESSLIRALDAGWQALRRPPIGPDSSVQAYFLTEDGELPVTLSYAPASAADVRANRSLMEALEHFFREFGAFGRENRLTPWLVYMPTKLRASYPHLRLVTADEELRAWSPTDLPDLIGTMAERHRIEFVDLTPVLAAETDRSGELLYNTIYDTHLNARGSCVVASELARHLDGTGASGAATKRRPMQPPC